MNAISEQENDLFRGKKLLFLFIIISGLFYLFLFNTLNVAPLSHNSWDSYSLQAEAWLKGKTYLDHDYSYLELASYKNKTFVSFPPVPTLPHLLLIPFFGIDTPNNLLTALYGTLSFLVACALLSAFSKRRMIIYAILGTFSCNLLVISACGGVWFQAQSLGFLLTLTGFYCVVKKSSKLSRHLGFLSLALAVGCRPFNAIYFPLLYYITCTKFCFENKITKYSNWLKSLEYLAFPTLVACILGFYNWIRFDNPLEFGHSYLKSYISSSTGQFNTVYIIDNFLKSLRLPTLTNDYLLRFEHYNGNLFFLINPIFISFLIFSIRKVKTKTLMFWTICFLSIAIHLLSLYSHDTMGGWHFGNRYLVDLIPTLILSFALFPIRVNSFDVILAAFGLMLNYYGAIEMYLKWK